MGSAVDINSPKCSIIAHQTEARAGPANKPNSIAIFDGVDVEHDFVK